MKWFFLIHIVENQQEHKTWEKHIKVRKKQHFVLQLQSKARKVKYSTTATGNSLQSIVMGICYIAQ